MSVLTLSKFSTSYLLSITMCFTYEPSFLTFSSFSSCLSHPISVSHICTTSFTLVPSMSSLNNNIRQKFRIVSFYPSSVIGYGICIQWYNILGYKNAKKYAEKCFSCSCINGTNLFSKLSIKCCKTRSQFKRELR